MSQRTNASIAAAGRGAQYLAFRLAGEIYAVPVRHVREIIVPLPITAVPNTPHYIPGVINLRGKIIPILDLRAKFGMKVEESTRETCIVVVEASAEQRVMLMGLLVDAVKDVSTVADDQIEPTPSFGVKVNTAFLSGVAPAPDGVRLLLNVEKVLTHEESAQVADSLAQAGSLTSLSGEAVAPDGTVPAGGQPGKGA